MPSYENTNNVIKEILARLHPDTTCDTQKSNQKKNGGSGEQNAGITPSQAIVIAALLAGVLEVSSVLIDREQTVEILLTGTLKKKSELEILLDQIGSKPFDEVIKAMLGRL